jgi:hypothetical protein
VLLAGSATAVDPAAHVPVVLADLTAVFAAEGTHSFTDEAAWATAPPEKPAMVTITGTIRRLTASGRMTPPFIENDTEATDHGVCDREARACGYV